MSYGPCGCNPPPGIRCAHGYAQSTAGPHFQGGPRRDVRLMAFAAAALRDEGKLPAEASLVFTQLLLNLAGQVGAAEALILINNFLIAADVPTGLDG